MLSGMLCLVLFIIVLVSNNYAVEFRIINREIVDVLVGIQGNPGEVRLKNRKFILIPGQEVTLTAPDNWAGHFWGRPWCDSKSEYCSIDKCDNNVACYGSGKKPPTSAARITLKGAGGLDYYDITLVNGFSIAMAIEPLDGQADGSQFSCRKTSCQVRINDQCPQELQVKNQKGQVIGCNSACNALGTDEYCCTGKNSRPETCRSANWPVNYPQYFKNRCLDAQSYIYDDRQSNFTCKANTYLVTLGVGTLHDVEFRIHNREIGPVWVGIQGNPGHAHLNNGGLVLGAGQQVSIRAPGNWAGRIWPRTWCDPNTHYCLTGDCGSKIECGGNGANHPVSIAEISLKALADKDYYFISLVEGFNIEIAIEPINGRGDGSRNSCKKTSCAQRINDQCPQELQIKNLQGNQVVGCRSACNTFNTDQYCCAGPYNSSEYCQSIYWPTDYGEFFKRRCPDAHSYSYDQYKRVLTCKASAYLIALGG